MPDIFLSYASEDRDTAKALYDLLKPLWEVTWDHPASGSYVEFVETNVPKSACMVVLISPVSRTKRTVLGEIDIANRRNITVIPAVIEACEIPYVCTLDIKVDLRGWRGDPQAEGYLQLLEKLKGVVPLRGKPQRLQEILGGRISQPSFFHSISSYETRLDPIAALQVVELARRKSEQVPQLLLSAYDAWELWAQAQKPGTAAATKRAQDDWQAMLEHLRAYRAHGGIVLLDSGKYEAGRLGDDSWSFRRLHRALRETPHDLAFCFDRLNPPRDPLKNADQVVKAVKRDGGQTDAPMLPIVHVPRAKKQGAEYLCDLAPQIVLEVALRLKPVMIAVPERELGAGIGERAATVMRIRERLSSLEFYQPLHILGTGDPWTIATLAAAGADSFDGLEWCRFVLDHDEKRLHHFHHLDFFSFQTRYDGPSGTRMPTDGLAAHVALAAEAYRDDEIRYSGRVAFHNLCFYTEFMEMVSYWADAGNFRGLLNRFPEKSQKSVGTIVPGLFR